MEWGRYGWRGHLRRQQFRRIFCASNAEICVTSNFLFRGKQFDLKRALEDVKECHVTEFIVDVHHKPTSSSGAWPDGKEQMLCCFSEIVPSSENRCGSHVNDKNIAEFQRESYTTNTLASGSTTFWLLMQHPMTFSLSQGLRTRSISDPLVSLISDSSSKCKRAPLLAQSCQRRVNLFTNSGELKLWGPASAGMMF